MGSHPSDAGRVSQWTCLKHSTIARESGEPCGTRRHGIFPAGRLYNKGETGTWRIHFVLKLHHNNAEESLQRPHHRFGFIFPVKSCHMCAITTGYSLQVDGEERESSSGKLGVRKSNMVSRRSSCCSQRLREEFHPFEHLVSFRSVTTV